MFGKTAVVWHSGASRLFPIMLCFLIVRLLTEKLLGERFPGMVQVHEPVVYPRWALAAARDQAPVPLCGRVHRLDRGAGQPGPPRALPARAGRAHLLASVGLAAPGKH